MALHSFYGFIWPLITFETSCFHKMFQISSRFFFVRRIHTFIYEAKINGTCLHQKFSQTALRIFHLPRQWLESQIFLEKIIKIFYRSSCEYRKFWLHILAQLTKTCLYPFLWKYINQFKNIRKLVKIGTYPIVPDQNQSIPSIDYRTSVSFSGVIIIYRVQNGFIIFMESIFHI